MENQEIKEFEEISEQEEDDKNIYYSPMQKNQ
jgi:hypothetical protein